MNKIVLQFGLLVFFLSLIFYSQQGISLQQVLIRSFVIFAVVTTMMSVLAITFIRAINKTSIIKDSHIEDNLVGSKDNE